MGIFDWLKRPERKQPSYKHVPTNLSSLELVRKDIVLADVAFSKVTARFDLGTPKFDLTVTDKSGLTIRDIARTSSHVRGALRYEKDAQRYFVQLQKRINQFRMPSAEEKLLFQRQNGMKRELLQVKADVEKIAVAYAMKVRKETINDTEIKALITRVSEALPQFKKTLSDTIALFETLKQELQSAEEGASL